MPQPSDRRIHLRWIFLIAGWFLIICDHFVIDSLLGIHQWAAHTYPGHFRHQRLIVLEFDLVLLAMAILCLITAWGLHRSRRWSRWTGICACAGLLPGYPWLTLAGAAGLFLIAKLPRLEAPPAPKQTRDYWTRKQKSWLQQVFAYVGFFVAMINMGSLSRYARTQGMPPWRPHGLRLLYVFVFSFYNIAMHEMGHALMAWALYSRVRSISVGPFTFANTGHGYQFHFNWRRLINGGGHVASVPTGGSHLRLKLIAVVAAGPAASLVNGVVMLVVFSCLAGTGWQAYWWIPALTGVLSIFDCFINLLPVGYSDGSMLFHLILWTRHGQALLNQLQAAQTNEDADVCHKRADFEREVELREAALARAQEGGEGNAVVTALCYQSLGHARLALEDWSGAASEHRTCLGFEAECSLHPPLAANAWLGLQKACLERHHVAEAARAYAGAVRVIEGRKKNRDKIGLAVTRAMMAQVHYRAGCFDHALPEISEALRILPEGRDRLMLLAILHSTEALCEFGLGSVERGLAAASRATDIVRSGKLRPEERNLGWDELGELGEELWRVGQDRMAVDLLREAIEQLELGGAAATAAQYRVKLSTALRQLGRLDEAWHWLPQDVALATITRRCLLAERARLHLACGRAEEAAADGRELVALWQAAPNGPVTEIAVAEALLAEAYLETRDYAQAEALARKAIDVLASWKHFETAGCLVTLGLIRQMPGCLEDARLLIEADPLLSAAAKTRILKAQATRVERSFAAAEDTGQEAYATGLRR
jgi:tetratricopeptide (TPR) repeat protein